MQKCFAPSSNGMQANFRNEAMLRQHQEGPAHKKAVARDKAQKEREAWMENPSAAANALVCLSWCLADTDCLIGHSARQSVRWWLLGCLVLRVRTIMHGFQAKYFAAS